MASMTSPMTSNSSSQASLNRRLWSSVSCGVGWTEKLSRIRRAARQCAWALMNCSSSGQLLGSELPAFSVECITEGYNKSSGPAFHTAPWARAVAPYGYDEPELNYCCADIWGTVPLQITSCMECKGKGENYFLKMQTWRLYVLFVGVFDIILESLRVDGGCGDTVVAQHDPDFINGHPSLQGVGGHGLP